MCKQVDELSEQLVKAQAQQKAQNLQGIENKARSAQAACARKVRTQLLTLFSVYRRHTTTTVSL